ncbi:amidohydrolase family protein [Variovorax sp. J31P207]|uniref:amidohydrolase family protein n=1 Tax=Variovorax sp. J31P207 TaxID=3053510 RepID=UPI0025779D10|nr:amidohydrolase family protein [Variovorax sp. J31P207]MDM0066788.1 amidohydrolase family protein [Variovorax sp. J31P207]
MLELATTFPRIPLILDHVGGLLGVSGYEGRQGAALQEWRPWMQRLAQCPNVAVKVGGLGTAVFGFDFAGRPTPPSSRQLADAWKPVVEPVLDLFGPQRCLFESNFPVDRSAAGYGVVWNAFKRLAAGATCEQKKALFHENAVRLYRLDLVDA